MAPVLRDCPRERITAGGFGSEQAFSGIESQGCEIATLGIGENLLVVDEVFDLAFFPCLADFKVEDVKGYADGFIDLCLFNGAIRNSENEEMAHLLRRKSKVLVAFGSCAYEGCIPALSNLTSRQATLNTVYLDNPSLDNGGKVLPQRSVSVPEGELTLPYFYNTVKALDQVVDVDYYLPGCPPEPKQIWAVLQVVVAALTQGAPLPAKGSVIGVGDVAVCEECPLEKNEKTVARFYRPYEINPVPGLCLLEQGLVCMGPATVSGCGALCPQVGMGCRGCYGPMPGVEDQGSQDAHRHRLRAGCDWQARRRRARTGSQSPAGRGHHRRPGGDVLSV